MAENDKSLFGGVNLNNMDFIEVPGRGEASVVVEETHNEQKTDDKSKNPDEQEDYGFIDIPDFVKEETNTKAENTEEKNTQEVQEEKTPSTNKGSSSSSPFKPFAKALYEEGVLTSYDETEFDEMLKEMSPAEALIELNRRTLESEIEAYKAEAEEEYKSFLDAREAGVNLDAWAESQAGKKKYASIKDEDLDSDEELQKALITSDLEKRGLDKETIKDTIESYEDTNKLAKQAKTALKNLKKSQEDEEKALIADAKKREADNAKAQKAQLDSLKKNIEDTKEIIPGLPINKQVKDKLFNLITSPVKQTENGQSINAVMAKRMEDPIKYALLEAYFVELGLFDGKFDKIITKAKTKAVTELEKQLSNKSNTEFSNSGKDGLETSEVVTQFESAFKRIK